MGTRIGKGTGNMGINAVRIRGVASVLVGGAAMFACGSTPTHDQPEEQLRCVYPDPRPCPPGQENYCVWPPPPDCDPLELLPHQSCPCAPPPRCSCVPATQTIAIAASENTTYAIRSSGLTAASGSVYAWGSNGDQEVGFSGLLGRAGDAWYTPIQVPLVLPAVQVAAGYAEACAVLTDTTVACWGLASFVNQIDNETPTIVDDADGNPLTGVVGVAVGGSGVATDGNPVSAFACAWTADHKIYCWGDNDKSQLGNGASGGADTEATPVVWETGIPVADAAEVALAGNSACYLSTTGDIFCWGDNQEGQYALGNSGPMQGSTVAYPSGLTSMTSLMGGGEIGTYCATRAGDGATFCWGANEQGETGHGYASVSDPPIPPENTPDGTPQGRPTGAPIAFGGRTACAYGAMTSCWGRGTKGQLADGQQLSQPQVHPLTVDALAGATALALGGSHGCAIFTDGSVRCWGANDTGQLGIGSASSGASLTVGVTF